MATEDPVRLVDRSSAGKWPSSRNADDFTFKSMKVEEFGLLMKDHKIHENQEDMVPNRSGSAPPSMEGSFAAVTNIMVQPSSGFCQNMENFSSSLGDYESEKQSCADPAYFAYYCSNVNLNPRLPPPLISREKRRLAQHIGGFGNKLRLDSFDDNANKPLNIFQLSLSTHKEELEDDKLLQKENDYWAGSNIRLSSLDSPSLLGFRENLVDLTQGNFPLLPSTVISQSHFFTNTTEDESVDHDILANMLNDPFLDVSKPDDPTPDSTEVCVGADVIALDSSDDPSPASSQGLSYYDGTGSSQSPQSDELINKGGSNLVNSREMDFSRLESGMRALNVSTHPVGDDERNRQEQRHYDRHMSQQGTGAPCQGRGVQPQIFSNGSNRSYSGTDKTSHVLPKLSSTGAQQALHSQGPTPSFYTAATAYTSGGSPLYHNLQAPSLFSPQFNVSGGYAYGSAIFAPYLTGYPPQNAMPVPLDISSGQNFNGQAFGISTGDGIPNGVDLQHLNKIYEHGIMLQSSLMDPVHMQYFLPSEVAYGAPGSYGQFAPTCDIGGQMDCFTLQKDALHENDHYFQPPSNGSVSSPSPRKEAAVASDYLLSSPNVGVVAQFPFLPLGCPMLLGSTVCGTNDPEQRVRFSEGSVPGISYGWQEQKRRESFNDQKKHYFLEELKANNARKFELSDVVGRIAEFSVDQHGSRFIQKKLEHWNPEEKESVFKEVLPHASKLMTDVFGNYVIQKFFEHGSHEQRKELANQLSGHMLSLSLQMYGCRVIQKAFEVIELDQKTQLVQELEGHVMKCVHDQNGNHVIQKCIECVPTKKIGFIIDAFRGHVSELSTHPYGCRVIQRVLEHCSDELQCCCVVDEILESACVLAQDQYGNYVIQHVLDRGKPHERSRIINKLSGSIVQMSQHKYASNVVERCLEHGDATERELLIREITGQSEENDNLLIMMKDQFANYVVQKILEISNDKQREMLIKRVRLHLNALKKYTYGKHIVARFEKVYGGETEG